jgi:hypothetical protein
VEPCVYAGEGSRPDAGGASAVRCFRGDAPFHLGQLLIRHNLAELALLSRRLQLVHQHVDLLRRLRPRAPPPVSFRRHQQPNRSSSLPITRPSTAPTAGRCWTCAACSQRHQQPNRSSSLPLTRPSTAPTAGRCWTCAAHCSQRHQQPNRSSTLPLTRPSTAPTAGRCWTCAACSQRHLPQQRRSLSLSPATASTGRGRTANSVS